MKLILFDVDGTLLMGFREHRDAFSYAAKKVFGVNAKFENISKEGLIDYEIMKEIIAHEGISLDKIEEKIDELFESEIEYFMSLKNYKFELLPGVKELLEALKDKYAIGLITGNLETLAFKKMEIAGIRKYFETGGFGNLRGTRADVAKLAVKRFEKLHDIDEVIMVGDTPIDISAGKSVGARVIATASGYSPKEELQDADLVVDDLTDTKKILNFIENV